MLLRWAIVDFRSHQVVAGLVCLVKLRILFVSLTRILSSLSGPFHFSFHHKSWSRLLALLALVDDAGRLGFFDSEDNFGYLVY
jgi:hypothetical protein